MIPADLRAEIDAELALVEPAQAPHVPGVVYGRRLAGQRARRRAGGAFYTPPHLVDFIVERTLGPVIDAGADPRSLRVVDPACGGGVFLLGALDYLVRRAGGAHAARIARDCLFGIDLDPIAVGVCRLAVSLAAGAEPQLAVGNALVGGFPIDGRFDAVVGNPPWGQKGFSWTDSDKAWVREHYACGAGVLDPYALFVERATELGDRWGMVLPDIILLKNQQDVRDVILDRCAIEWIADSQRAFPGAAIDTVVMVARRGAAAGGHAVSVWHSLPESWRAEPPPTVAIPQSLFGELPGHKFNIRVTPEARALWRRLDELPRLGDRFEAHEGVHTGNARGKLFAPERGHDRCVPVIVGRDELGRGRVDWGGTWLDLDPTAIDRSAGDYARVGRPEWFERSKILVRRTGDRVVAAHDERGYYCSNNMFVVIPRAPMTDDEQRAYVALLNSALLTWYFRTVQPRAGRLFPELKIHHLLSFPVPASVESLIGLRGAPVDDAVFALYTLTADEIALVRA